MNQEQINKKKQIISNGIEDIIRNNMTWLTIDSVSEVTDKIYSYFLELEEHAYNQWYESGCQTAANDIFSRI